MKKYVSAMAALFSTVSVCAMAQSYPDKAITMIVPFSAGGPTDTVARLTAEAMSQELGQQVVVQNVGGAGGTLGAGQAAQAAPVATPSSCIISACPRRQRCMPTFPTMPSKASSRSASSPTRR